MASLVATPKSSDGAAACGCEEAVNELDLSANTTMTGNDASLLDESAEATKASSASPAQAGVPYAEYCMICTKPLEDDEDRWEEYECVNIYKEPSTCGNWVCNICSEDIKSGNLHALKFCQDCGSFRCPDCDSKKLRSERGDCECQDCRFEVSLLSHHHHESTRSRACLRTSGALCESPQLLVLSMHLLSPLPPLRLTTTVC
jgi:hypothetical protein